MGFSGAKMYKNNYQRKQAVWREKWMKKVETRQRMKSFRDLNKAVDKMRQAFVDLADVIESTTLQFEVDLREIAKNLSKEETL